MVNIYHPNMQGISGFMKVIILLSKKLGWLIDGMVIESGDEHEINTIVIEQILQNREENDRVLNDTIFQVRMIGEICTMHGQKQRQIQVIYEFNLHQIG